MYKDLLQKPTKMRRVVFNCPVHEKKNENGKISLSQRRESAANFSLPNFP